MSDVKPMTKEQREAACVRARSITQSVLAFNARPTWATDILAYESELQQAERSRDEAYAARERAEADAAAMRTIIDKLRAEIGDPHHKGCECVNCFYVTLVDRCLAGDAGRALLERHAAELRAKDKEIAEWKRLAEASNAQLAMVRANLDTMIRVHDEVEAERDALKADVEWLIARVQEKNAVALDEHLEKLLVDARDALLEQMKRHHAEIDRLQAALGRATAVLLKLAIQARPFAITYGVPLSRGFYEELDKAEQAARAVLADPTSAHEGELHAALLAEHEAAIPLQPWPNPLDFEKHTRAVAVVTKLLAPRGGA